MFNFQSVQWKYPDNNGSGCTVIPVTTNRDIQQYYKQLASRFKDFDITINHTIPNRLHDSLKGKFQHIQKQHLQLMNRYMNEIKPIIASKGLLDQKMQDRIQLVLDDFKNDLEDLEAKAEFINKLNKNKFQYINAINYNLNRIYNEHALIDMLLVNNRQSRILCSNDTLNINNPSKLDELFHQLGRERNTNKKLRLIYADCSYCPFELHDMMILPSKTNSIGQRQPSSSQNDVINILLLGETGVGKSTFINAFINYLTFNTLKQAETNKPVVLIPVSFLITTGHDFKEHTVKFGDFKSSNNEDFNRPGQSVTQHCKSHLIDLSHINGKKFCIIDTPGFGDTRGVDQDDLNMQDILEYINNLSHLNAVCFLLKPNASRLNVFLRTCLTQLLDLLGPNAHQNIIFCFTNARSTFYTPGDTAPLLRTMLDSLDINDIPFKKENTFCFDNESFRYLVALQNGIRFDEEEKHEYEGSWKTSMNESNRLLNYIHTQLNPYHLHNQRQSNKEIIQMVRPILETMRNTLRNTILRKVGSSDKYIELCPQAIHHPIWFCTLSKRDPFLLGKFWILPDDPQTSRDQCRYPQCDPTQHIPMDYLLSYDTSKYISPDTESNDMLDRLCFASAELAHSIKEDLLLAGLTRMIAEEKQICSMMPDTNHLNSQLIKELEQLKHKYEEHMKEIKSNPNHQDSQSIDQQIQAMYEFPSIRKQMAAIK